MSDEEQSAEEPQKRSAAAFLDHRRQQLLRAGKPVPASLMERIAAAETEESTEPED